MGEWSHWNRESPRQPKVSQLEFSILSYEYILWLHVPMHYPVAVAGVDA